MVLDASHDWPADIEGHPGIRVRALTVDELRAARDAATRRAPPDLYGERVYAELALEWARRVEDERALAAEAATVADEFCGRLKAGDPVEAETVRAVDIATRALRAFIDEAEVGRLRIAAKRRHEDPVAASALDRHERWMMEPALHIAARAVTAWPGGPVGVAEVLDRLECLPDDVTGYGGKRLAVEITAHALRGALDDRGKGASAPRPSSRAAVASAGRGRKKNGRAKHARKRA